MFPLFLKFISMHCTLQTHYFHAYKCNSDDCSFHMPLWNNLLNHFGDLVPYTDENGKEHYHLGEDPDEKYMPSKLENPAKRKHRLPFPLTAQTALNIGIMISRTECWKSRLIYSKSKLKPNYIKALKRSLNCFCYICGSSFQEVTLDDCNSNILTNVFSRENISYESKIKQPYYLCKIQSCLYTLW